MNSRRDFVRTVSASLFAPTLAQNAVAAAHVVTAAEAAPAASGRPNVVLMICDDLGYGDLGCYGSSIPTPHLDRLAAEGTRCTHYNTPHPICSASRSAVLTGRYAPRTGTIGALFPDAAGTSLQEQMLPELFRAKGYATHAIGKWHLGDQPAYLPTNRGFDSFYGVPYSDDMQPLPLMRDTNRLDADTDRDELTPRYTSEAVKLIETAADKPFFLYLAYSYPHDPARGSKAFRGRSAFGDYGDAVEEIDWSVGKVMDALGKTGKADNTIVIFTSDHGPWFQGSPGALRGRKGSTFEGGTRVPFLVRWHGKIPSSTVCTEWLGHLNLVPTLREWCGLEAPRLPLDGFDMSATLLHRQTAPAKPVLYFIPSGKYEVQAIRAGRWKLRVSQGNGQIYINDRPGAGTNYLLPQPELYDLQADPAESYDMAAKHPDTVAQLLATIDREIETFPNDIQQNHAELKQRVANRVTPPGAAARVLTGPQPAWAWEPPDRR